MLPDAAPRLCLQGSAACAVAAFFRLRHLLAGRNVVVLCCGGNVALPTLKQVCPPPRAVALLSMQGPGCNTDASSAYA